MRKLLLHLTRWFGSARASVFAILSIALLIHPLSLSSASVALQSGPSPDFDGDGMVGFSDFVQFADKFGSSPRNRQFINTAYRLCGDASGRFRGHTVSRWPEEGDR